MWDPPSEPPISSAPPWPFTPEELERFRLRPFCRGCGIRPVKHGTDRDGEQRWLCRNEFCDVKTFTAGKPEKPLSPMRLPLEKCLQALSAIVEGTGVRATARMTGIDKDTVCRLIRVAGDKCERLLADLIKDVPADNVEVDEQWSFIYCKNKTKERKGIDKFWAGDSWGFYGIDRDSKLILAHQVGKRSWTDMTEFLQKLDDATAGRFQLNSDAFPAYEDCVGPVFGEKVDHAIILKNFQAAPPEDQRRYSPARIISVEKWAGVGSPDLSAAGTSIVERFNLSMRLFNKRFTRLTSCFSKAFKQHKAAVSLMIAHYNLCKKHRTLKTTPAVAAGITPRAWTLADLVTVS